MAAVQFNCPHCAGLFQVDDSMAGQQVGCPSCGSLLVLPTMNPSVAPSQPPRSTQENSPPQNPMPTVPQQSASNNSPAAMYPPGMQPGATGNQTNSGPVPQQPATPLYPPGHEQTARPASPDGMLPPGVDGGATKPSNRPIPTSASKAVSRPTSDPTVPAQPSAAESLLPPGAERATSGGTKIESMLPPGSQTPSSPVAANVRPDTPVAATDEKQSGPVVIPTADGDYVAVREPVKTVGYGDDEVELRQLTAEEKARRRLKKNLILWGFGLLVIGVTLAILLAIGPIGS